MKQESKLSKLQRWIVCRAAHKPDISEHGGCHLLTARVMHEYYKAPLSRYLCGAEPDNKVKIGHKNFNQFAIGAKEYNARKAAISKAFRRLEERGLATRMCAARSWRAGVNLTGRSEAVAKQLTANTRPNPDSY